MSSLSITAEVCNPSVGEDEAGGWRAAECITNCLPSASTVPPGGFLGTVSGATKCPLGPLWSSIVFLTWILLRVARSY